MFLLTVSCAVWFPPKGQFLSNASLDSYSGDVLLLCWCSCVAFSSIPALQGLASLLSPSFTWCFPSLCFLWTERIMFRDCFPDSTCVSLNLPGFPSTQQHGKGLHPNMTASKSKVSYFWIYFHIELGFSLHFFNFWFRHSSQVPFDLFYSICFLFTSLFLSC